RSALTDRRWRRRYPDRPHSPQRGWKGSPLDRCTRSPNRCHRSCLFPLAEEVGAHADAAIIQLDNLAVVVAAQTHPRVLSWAVLGGFVTNLDLDAEAPVLQLNPILALSDDHLG